MIEVNISPEVFDRFPGFVRGLVLAQGFDNQSDASLAYDWLTECQDWRSREPIDLAEDFRCVDWREAHREFGSNPNRFPPSHLALLKRVQKGGRVPPISPAIALMTATSLQHVIPVGGDDVDALDGQVQLRFAKGDEAFTPLGKPGETELAEVDEVIYVVGSGAVACRRWNWRNGHETRIMSGTTSILFNFDVIGKDAEQRALAARDDVSERLVQMGVDSVLTDFVSIGRATVTMG